MSMMTDADLGDDRANDVLTEHEQGRAVVISDQTSLPCYCTAVPVSTIAGVQWVESPVCNDPAHEGHFAI